MGVPMRIRLSLHSVSSPARLPINYVYYLTSLIYKILFDSSSEYSTFLHDHGYRSEEKPFKLFSFSQLLIPNRRIEGETLICYSPQIQWQITSAVEPFIQHLITGLFAQKEIVIAQTRWQIASVETLAPPPFLPKMKFLCLSPLTISTGMMKEGKLQQVYLPPDDPFFSENIRQNLIRKYKLVFEKEPNDPSFRIWIDEDYVQKKKRSVTRLVDFKGTKIRGYLAPFWLEGNPELIQVGYECGFGDKNSLGFGMMG
jgi:CRISPR-associated endoribonuclease Cas6